MRTIIPTKLADLPRAAEYAGPGAEFYVKELVRLDQWRGGVPHLPHNRVWCGLNSFNIPRDYADNALLSLQGAGDLMILSQFIHDIGGVDYVTCYRDRAGVLGKGIPVYPIARIGPTELRFCQIRHIYSYVSNHPAALQFLMRDAMDEGWDHYDWFGLMLGIVPKEKWVHIEWENCLNPLAGNFISSLGKQLPPEVVVHLKASTENRSAEHILPMLHHRFPDVHFIILGDGGMSYHESHSLLCNPLVRAVIAVDSVILHMAVVARPDLPVLGLYTSTPTTWRGPDRPGVDRIHIDKSDSSRYHKEVTQWIERHLKKGSMG